MIQLQIISQNDATFNRRDVMRKKEAKGIHGSERAGLAASNLGVHRFTIVFEQVKAVLPSEFLDDVQRGRVAQDTHGDDHTSLWSQSTLQLPHVHIQSLQLDVDESQLESVLLERMKRGTPRDRGNNHLICALQRPVFFIK